MKKPKNQDKEEEVEKPEVSAGRKNRKRQGITWEVEDASVTS